MFENWMKSYLRRRGYRVRRMRKPSSALKRMLYGGMFGTLAGYLLDSKTAAFASRMLEDPSLLASILSGARERASASQSEGETLRGPGSETEPFIGIPKDGYRKIGKDPGQNTRAYVAPGALLIAIRDDNALFVLSADEVADLLELVGEAIQKRKDDQPSKPSEPPDWYKWNPPIDAATGDPVPWPGFTKGEPDVDAAEEAFGRGMPAAQAVKGYRRVKVQAPVRRDLTDPYKWQRVSPLVEVMVIKGQDVTRARFEGGDSGYVDLTAKDIKHIKKFADSEQVDGEWFPQEKGKLLCKKVGPLVVVKNSETQWSVEFDKASIRMVEIIHDLAHGRPVEAQA